MGLLAKILFGYRTLTQNFVTVPGQNTLEVEGAATVVDDPANERTILTVGGAGTAATFGATAVASLAVGANGQQQLLPAAPVVTLNGSTSNLASGIALPAGKEVKIRAEIFATIVSATQIVTYSVARVAWYRGASGVLLAALLSGPTITAGESFVPASPWSQAASSSLSVTGAANNGSGAIRLAVTSTAGMGAGNTVAVSHVVGTVEANGQWAVDVIDGNHLDLRGSTFTNAYSGPAGTLIVNGCTIFTLAASTVRVQAVGITPAKWIQSEGVVLYDLRYDATSGQTYMCSQAGTTSNSGTGPTGTGSGIVDGTAHWDWLQAGQGCPITWTVVKLEELTG